MIMAIVANQMSRPPQRAAVHFHQGGQVKMKYKVTLNGKTYEVEVEAGQGHAGGRV